MTSQVPLDRLAYEQFSLSRDEIARFHRDGYLGPFAVCRPEKMDHIRAQLDEKVLAANGPGGSVQQSRHLDSKIVWDLCHSAAIVDRVVSLYGEDIVLWRSNFFDKGPGAKEIPWHQDINYWPIVPDVNISAWLAITESTIENSCVYVIPGSHRAVVPHVKARGEVQFQEEADLTYVDVDKAVPIELQPGEFFLFTEKLLHFSHRNSSQKRRCGLSIRMTVPFVKVEHDKLFEGHRNLLLHGSDRMGFNQIGSPPQN